MPDSTYAARAACELAAGSRVSPSKRGSSMSARRLNGANFSRAMRSQVSSTDAKVSREWSAKRGRVEQAPRRAASRTAGSRACRASPCFPVRPSAAVTAIVADAFITSVRSLPASAHTLASVKVIRRPGFSTWRLAHQALAARRAQQAGLQLRGEDPAALGRQRLRGRAHRVVGHRRHHAGVHDTGVLRVAALDAQLARHGALADRGGHDAQVHHERRRREDGARELEIDLHAVSARASRTIVPCATAHSFSSPPRQASTSQRHTTWLLLSATTSARAIRRSPIAGRT